MKIVITRDNGVETVHQDVTDYYLAIRQHHPIMDDAHRLTTKPDTKSISEGDNLREIAKEVSQSVIEIQDFLRVQRQKGP